MEGKGFPNPYSGQPPFQTLSEEKLHEFFDDLDRDNDGYVVFEELEAKLEKVPEELAPDPNTHHLHRPDRRKTTGSQR